MISYQRKMMLIALHAIFIVAFSYTSIAFATNGNDEHAVMKKDSDGKVSQEDFIEHHRWMFEKNDANKDGFLNKSEMKALHKMVKEMHKRSEAH
ncbi:MAG: hypothetical protein K0U40_02700 [Betaproteobacteria bacterium]|nr:hypothetical protein [Betaproteobacteria bacterium]